MSLRGSHPFIRSLSNPVPKENFSSSFCLLHIYTVNLTAAVVLLGNDNGFSVVMKLETMTGLESSVSPRNAD